MRRALPILASLFLASSLSAGEPAAGKEISFTGVLASSGHTMICLTETGSSHWLELGESFGDYRVATYHADTETVELTEAGVSTWLKLVNSAKVQAGAAGVRRALWEKIKNLDGLDLVRELVAAAKTEPPGDPSFSALDYLGKASERLEAEASAQKLALEKLAAKSDDSDGHRLAVSSAQRNAASANSASVAIRDRIVETAVVLKKSVHDSQSLP